MVLFSNKYLITNIIGVRKMAEFISSFDIVSLITGIFISIIVIFLHSLITKFIVKPYKIRKKYFKIIWKKVSEIETNDIRYK